MMFESVPPAVILIVGAALISMLPRGIRPWILPLFPMITLACIAMLPTDHQLSVSFANYELALVRVDSLSRIFGIIFAIVTLIGGVYTFHAKGRIEQVAALLYSGGAIGVVFSGDYLTLFVFWELMAVSSTLLIWANSSANSVAAGFRYLYVHLFGGSVLLAGILCLYHGSGSLLISGLEPGTGAAAYLILIGVSLNAAIPPMHAWLADAYPRATITGAIFMSALTTKTAVYVLARVFPGWEVLTILGVAMALYGVVYAVLSNDIRELLAYHIISQVGYMVAGVGMGTQMAINGTTAHAFSHILYKALLFMGAGAVLHATGKSKLTELGGLSRQMPWIVSLYMIGAFSISGFPFFNGFVSKSLVVHAAAETHRYGVYHLLQLASIGTFLHTGLKLPYFTWFGPQRGLSARKVPRNMLLAMGLASILCVATGTFPSLLYRYLPSPVHYNPYTQSHLAETAQTLVFTFLAFWLIRGKLGGEATVSLDFDWFYRRPKAMARLVSLHWVASFFSLCEQAVAQTVRFLVRLGKNPARFRLSGTTPFDPDRARQPAGLTITLILLTLSLVALYTLWH